MLMQQGQLIFGSALLLAHLPQEHQAVDGDIPLHAPLQAAQAHHGVAGRAAGQALARRAVQEGLPHAAVAKIVPTEPLRIA